VYFSFDLRTVGEIGPIRTDFAVHTPYCSSSLDVSKFIFIFKDPDCLVPTSILVLMLIHGRLSSKVAKKLHIVAQSMDDEAICDTISYLIYL
jgi:hypothetical protein